MRCSSHVILATSIRTLSNRVQSVYALTCTICQVTELCTGGELFDRIIAKTESVEGRYSESDAANIVHKILGYTHDLTAAALQWGQVFKFHIS